MNKETNVVGFSMGSLGNNLISGVIGSYLLTFYTEVYGIPAFAAGVIMLLAKIWDAVNDPMIGMLADRRKPGKNGKYRPMLRIFGPLFALFAVLSFCSPELPIAGRIVWACVTYIGYGMLFTCFDVPFWACVNRLNVNTEKRNTAIGMSRSMIMWAMLISSMFFTQIAGVLGNGNDRMGYPLALLVFAVPGVILMLICYRSARETVVEEPQAEHVSMIQMFKNLFKVLTPQLGLTYIVAMLAGLCVTLGPTVGVYFMLYYMGDVSKISLYMFCCIGSVAIASLFGASIQKRISEKKLLIICYAISAVANIGIWFMGTGNMAITLVLIFISGLGCGIANVPMISLVLKMANQAAKKNNTRADASVMSLNSLTTKIGQALASFFPSLILTATGYVANAEQTDSALRGILITRSILPAVLLAIAVVIVAAIRVRED